MTWSPMVSNLHMGHIQVGLSCVSSIFLESSLSSSTSSTTTHSDKSLWTSAREHSRRRRLQLCSQPPSHDEGEEDGGEQQEKGDNHTINTFICCFDVPNMRTFAKVLVMLMFDMETFQCLIFH